MARHLTLFAILLACGGCQTDPVSGRRYYSPLGADYASQDEFVRNNYLTELLLAREGGLLNEPEIVAACEEIFARVAAAVPPDHRRDFRYHFLLTASPDVNAYTYGAGRIHCHLGLLARCRDAAEFATVMAHEIGHNSHDHFGQSLGRASVGGSLARIGWLGGPPGRRLTESVAGLVAVQFTRTQEREADDRGVDYARAAGFDPDGLARFFEAMERDFGHEGGEFFRTHPHPENRVRAIRERIAGGENGNLIRTTPRFAAALERARVVLPFYVRLQEALAGDDEEEALEASNAGVAALPHHSTFHFWRGALLHARNDADGARVALRAAAVVDRGNLFVPLVWAVLEFQAEDWEATELAANRLLAYIPVMPSGFYLRGVARVRLGKPAEGRRDLDTAVELMPRKERKKLLAEIRRHVPDYAPPE